MRREGADCGEHRQAAGAADEEIERQPIGGPSNFNFLRAILRTSNFHFGVAWNYYALRTVSPPQATNSGQFGSGGTSDGSQAWCCNLRPRIDRQADCGKSSSRAATIGWDPARRFPPPWHGPSVIRPARDDDVLPAFRRRCLFAIAARVRRPVTNAPE
jgi:hypothetical protein